MLASGALFNQVWVPPAAVTRFDEDLAFFNTYMETNLKSPLMPEHSVHFKTMTVQNVVAGASYGPRAGKRMHRVLEGMSEIDFTGKVFRTYHRSSDELVVNRRVNCLLAFDTSARQRSGATSIDQALLSLHEGRFIEDAMGYDCEFDNFHVDNVVASGRFGEGIDLAGMKYADQTGIAWSPEQFPGAMLFLPGEKTVCLFFDTGQMIAVGLQNTEQIPLVNAHCVTLLRAHVNTPPETRMSNMAIQRCIKKKAAGKGKGNPAMSGRKMLKLFMEHGTNITLEDVLNGVIEETAAEAKKTGKTRGRKRRVVTPEVDEAAAVDAFDAEIEARKKPTHTRKAPSTTAAVVPLM